MKKPNKYLFATLISLTVIALPAMALAVSFDTTFAGSLGFTSTDLKQTILNVVSFILGLLGLIALVVILYGVFSLATSGGNEDKTDTAKRLISSAVVGLIVVLLSWAIVNFVLKTTAQVTN
ncbi:MAG: hypothetical protein WCT08_04465 [Patescibacteria group bacterium]|jgi:hypothetical protein